MADDEQVYEDELPNDADDMEKVRKIHKRYKSARDHTQDWRVEARDAFEYAANKQWTDEEIAILREELRPHITFNRMGVFIRAVVGLEALNRQEVRYIPRQPGPVQTGATDLWTSAAHYINDDTDAEVHHSEAFQDLVTCGMGWTDTFMDFDTNPDGDVKIQHVDPLFMFWDHRASNRNLSDRRWCARVKPMSRDEIKEQWPDKADQIQRAGMFNPEKDPPAEIIDADNQWKYEDDGGSTGLGDQDLWVMQYQEYENEPFYRVATPAGIKEFPEDMWNLFKQRYPKTNLKAIRMTKRRYKQTILCGTTILEESDLPDDGFTLCCMTGLHDRNDNVWFGLFRGLKDPQDWVNKLFSQILHILNSNAKGGLLAERDAFDNTQEAEQAWARADRITWARPGALSQNKIEQKKMQEYPVGLDRLLTFSMGMFTDVSGANLELLGMADKVQAGVLEAQRKQAGMTILSWAFDSLRAYRRAHGRVLAGFIREYIADGRLIRIAGEEGQQYIPLVRDEMHSEYDVIVDENPQSPNEKERVFMVLMELFPHLVKAGVMPPESIIDYLPLPASLIEEWKQQAQGDPEEEQRLKALEEQMNQLMMAKEQAEVQKTQSEAEENQSQTVLNEAKARSEMAKAADTAFKPGE